MLDMISWTNPSMPQNIWLCIIIYHLYRLYESISQNTSENSNSFWSYVQVLHVSYGSWCLLQIHIAALSHHEASGSGPCEGHENPESIWKLFSGRGKIVETQQQNTPLTHCWSEQHITNHMHHMSICEIEGSTHCYISYINIGEI